MMNIEKSIRERKSVRTFDGQELSKEDREKLSEFMKNIELPFDMQIEFQFLEGMNCPVVVGTNLYVGAKLKDLPFFNEAFGYAFEKFILFAQSLGIGTVWIGGTMDRALFEKEMNLKEDELMPCVSPIGYPAKKMSLRESLMRKGINADERKSFEEIVFINSFDQPLHPESANELYLPLEMVRLAPSAVNRQPWRILVDQNYVHFYLKRSKNFHGGKIDMQKIDMGIALCHFDLMCEEMGIKTEFVMKDPQLASNELEYVASYRTYC